MIVYAYRCDISPCVDCRYCWENNGCAIEDEMQAVYRFLQECDNILIASPIYFSELTGNYWMLEADFKHISVPDFSEKRNVLRNRRKVQLS